ncbi:MAG: LCP family protein [Ardenticatenia bacterium]|nr:LCP family protein [Ardenticatenia bacterium]
MQRFGQHDRTSLYIPWFDLFMAVLLVLFLGVGLVTDFLFYRTVRRFVATSELPFFPSANVLPRISLRAPELITAPPTTVPHASPNPTVDATMVGSSVSPLDRPMTVLVMGIDRRQGEKGPWRTDTMILVRVDPVAKKAAMISIPRDLYVLIPDYGRGAHFERINTANVYGDLFDYPGGGPALAKRTIYRNFGIQVDRYVIVDFDGFRKLIDMIGGIEVDVPRKIVDTQYPTEDYGYTTVRFEAGLQHMDGERALQYARTRKSTSDFDRAKRQQQVMMAVRDKVLSLDILPSLTPRNVLNMINTLGTSVQTDLTLEEILALAQVGQEIRAEDISQVIIDANYVIPRTINEAEVLVPRWERIRQLLTTALGEDVVEPVAPIPTVPPPTPTPDADALRQAMLAEQARVALLDATGQSPQGLQGIVAAMVGEGLNVVVIEPVDPQVYTANQLLVYAEKPATVAWLQEAYGIADTAVQQALGTRTDVDVALVLVSPPAGNGE